ncbi:MAG: ABC transporter ATP-binding protein [Brachybacterium sp.]|uniref:ABC transporter ATP-binding protein n=1 Tax=Brachybacterium sp. TaxID=1891286 RepID=UPI0026470B0B|nr:ABC transporter ATP-binding protein [Brachybacterium sp.]MDN5685914.1 ABC transporter ATP-binding protein [Brachybacterium sp.]
MTAPITLRELVKEYPDGVRGVDGVDLSIDSGEFFALLGPSGCGKTTLLRSIAGLESITEGTLEIGNKDVTHEEPGDRGVAMVFQDYALFPHMDVADNIAYPLRIQGLRKRDRRERAGETGTRLSLGALLERRPGQLSGGQQQRVALARAMSARPEVLLLDEPLSNLDARLRLEARGFLKELQQDLALTTVFVTHDQAEALALADRIAVMRTGRIEQIGTPREVFHEPRTMFVASFIGSQPMNLVHGRWEGCDVEVLGGRIALPDQVESSESAKDVIVGFRPEYVDMQIASSEESPPGGTPTGSRGSDGQVLAEITTVENLGATVLVTAHIGEEKIQAIVPDDAAPDIGTTGRFGIRSSRVVLFDPESGERVATADSAR